MEGRLVFEVQGSGADPYTIVATRAGGRFWITCTCPAGENGSHCKHRVALLAGVVDTLVSENPEEVARLPAMMEGTSLPALLAEFNTASDELEAAKRKMDKLKKRLNRALLGEPS
jgi:uncharacterized Zn finger protein